MRPRGHLARSVLLVAVLAGAAVGLDSEFSGRASGWLGVSRDSSYRALAGLRYLPEVRASLPVTAHFTLDAEASVNASISVNARPFDPPEVNPRIKPYRGYSRLSSAQFEARAGLQKINFGSALLLRPLMWFDRVDPRDPLELTDGVYGLLARYYFLNNVNVWAWGLLGNSSPKGWERIGSARWTPEPGARVQVPVPRGEVAATYHHRLVDYGREVKIPEMLDEQGEDRFGIDGKVDVGIGLWAEGTLSRETRRLTEGEDQPVWTRAAVAGADYTFGIGAGLLVTAEHMLAGIAGEPFGSGVDAQFSALMVSLPVGLLDNLRAMVYYDWRNEDPYSYIGWQRTLDNWVFSFGAFWNPELIPDSTAGPTASAAGKGLRVDAVFNH